MTRTPLLAALLLAALLLGLASPALAGDEDLRAVAQGNSAFALDLYGHLKEKPGNLFFSPFSVSAALAMTMAGARGDTEAGMGKALRLDLGREKLAPAFGALLKDLNDRKMKGRWQDDPNAGKKPFELVVANALWGQKGYPFKADFLGLLKRSYEAGLQEADFGADPDKARKAINAWVEEKTKNKIREILPPGTVPASTRLVLANAIYFKAAWVQPFEKEATREGEFLLSSKEKVRVPFMRRTGDFRYAETESMQVLTLPYQGGDLAMAVLLPKAVEGLPELEKGLDAGAFWRAWDAAASAEVNVQLPKFKIESAFPLNDALISLGMGDAFAPGKADFTGMADTKELFIGFVIHKTFVDVNEAGTEAAAATVVGMLGGDMPAEPKAFKADRPFLFAIVDGKTRSILFLGRVANPAK